MNIFRIFKKTKNNDLNLPTLIKNMNKSELTSYKPTFIEEKTSDPLYMRIKVKEIDYITRYRNELSFYKKYILYPLRKNFAKIKKFRYEQEIYRPNPSLREMHFNLKVNKYKISYQLLMILVIFYSYLIGYIWSKLKYDTKTRRFMYCYVFSTMMVFEYLDYIAESILEKVNRIIPKDMSDKEFEYILYSKIRNFYTKRKLKKMTEDVLNTNEDLLEIEGIMKKL
jgi:hypothetical protein